MINTNKQLAKQYRHLRRRIRVRARIIGTKERPRLSVFRSLRHIMVQLIDDANGKTLIAVSDREIKGGDKEKKTDLSFKVGELVAKKATAAKITQVVFDRSGHAYHGRVKAVAEGARKGGLSF